MYSLQIYQEVVCVVVIGYLTTNYCLRFDNIVVCAVIGCIVDHYCLRFDRREVCCCGWFYYCFKFTKRVFCVVVLDSVLSTMTVRFLFC